MPYKFKSSPELVQINFVYESYKKNGQIYLYIVGNEKKENLAQYSGLFSTNKIEHYVRQFGPCKEPDGYLFVISVENCRKIVDCLYVHQKIVPADRADIEPELKKIDIHIRNLDRVKQEISTAQADILKDLFGFYFEEIFDIAGALETALIFLKFSLSNYPSFPDWAGLLDHLLRKIIVKQNIDKDTKARLFGAMNALSKTFYGNANLESAFLQTGSGIPALKLQRQILLSCAKNCLVKRFSDLDNTVLFNTLLELNLDIFFGWICGGMTKPTNVLDNITITATTPYKVGEIVVKPDFIVKLIAVTLNEANLSINEIAAYERVKLLKIFKQSWELLQAADFTTISLTDEEQQCCLNILNKIDNSMELHVGITSKDNIQKSESASKVLKELLYYQKLIQNGRYFERRQLVGNITIAAEKQKNKKKTCCIVV